MEGVGLLRERENEGLTARTPRTRNAVLRSLLLAGALHGGLLAAGAGGFFGAHALGGAAAAGCWLDHFWEGLFWVSESEVGWLCGWVVEMGCGWVWLWMDGGMCG